MTASVHDLLVQLIRAASRFDVAATDLVRRFAILSLAQRQLKLSDSERALWIEIIALVVRHVSVEQLSKRMQELWLVDALEALQTLQAGHPCASYIRS